MLAEQIENQFDDKPFPTQSGLQPNAMTATIIDFNSVIERIKNEGSFEGWIPLSMIVYNNDINPRKYIKPKVLQERKESLRRTGQITPILLRISLVDNCFEVVAGTTRTEAMRAINGQAILASVRVMTDAEAREAAGVENIQRDDMTETEEADYAKGLMIENANDKAEVMRITGWSPKKLESRLRITHVTDEVRLALAKGEIKLGHVEVLCTLSEEVQKNSLVKIIQNGWTVPTTKEKVQKLERPIISACFDTTECQSCEHNTETFQDLFDAIGEDDSSSSEPKCRNSKCWAEKTLSEVKLIQSKKQEEYGIARLDTEIAADTIVTIEPKGKSGVGKQQMGACTQCVNFGCVVRTQAGYEGKTQDNVCFDLTCHSDKVNAYQKLIATDRQPSQSGMINDSDTPESKVVSRQNISPSKSTKNQPIKTKTIAKKVVTYAMEQFASLVDRALDNNVHLCNTYAIAAMSEKLCQQDRLTVFKLVDINDHSTNGYNTLHAKLYALSPDKLFELQVAISKLLAAKSVHDSYLDKGEYNRVNIAILKALKQNLKGQWTIDKNFLEALPSIAAIKSLLEESGFTTAYKSFHGDKKYSTLFKGKKDALIKGILDFKEFDWSHSIPKNLQVGAY